MSASIRTITFCTLFLACNAWSLNAQDELPPPAPSAGAAMPLQPDGPSSQDGMEVLTSGPLHEAFADTVRYQAEPGILVDREPPASIEELPPESQPAGRDVVWIPGYWGWDDERDDYIWITGVFRNRPPGHRWVPGYWAPTGAQWQWVSGFWVADEAEEIAYLPEPPESLDQGPSSPSPSQDYFWNPGCWNWRSANYAWRAGYWARCQPNWMWYPTYYSWTPRGYVCVHGRWDRPWATRGLCFAPVHYSRPLYRNSGYYYRPSVAFNASTFAWNLFVRPGYGHYYIGNYGGSRYDRYGYRPWCANQWGRSGYDPFYNYYRWSNGRNNPRWEDQVRERYQQLARNDERGPRDFAAYQAQRDRLDQRDRVASTLPELQRSRGENNVRLVENRNRTNEQLQASARQFRELNNRRRETELTPNGDTPTARVESGEARNRGNAAKRGSLELPPAARTSVGIEARNPGRSGGDPGNRVVDQGARSRSQRDFTGQPGDSSQASPRSTQSYRAFRDAQENAVVPDGRGGNRAATTESRSQRESGRNRSEPSTRDFVPETRNLNPNSGNDNAQRSRSRAPRTEFNRAPSTEGSPQFQQRETPQQFQQRTAPQREFTPRNSQRIQAPSGGSRMEAPQTRQFESRSRSGGEAAQRSMRSAPSQSRDFQRASAPQMRSSQPMSRPQMSAPSAGSSRQSAGGGEGRGGRGR